MRRTLASCSFVLLAGIAAAGGKPQGELPEILRRSVKASPSSRYIGVRVVQFRRGPETIRHTEYVTRDGSRLRIEFPKESPFAGQVIVETKSERRHFFPDRNEIHVLPPRREEAFERLARFVRGRGKFRFALGSDEVVAGKSTEQVVVSDPAGNIVQRLYIEPQSAVVLKRELFDPVGTRVGGFEFTEVDLTPRIDSKLFKIQRRGARLVTPAQLLEQLARREGFRLVSLPAVDGVRLEWSGVRPIDGESVLIQSYSVPHGRLTLFQMRRIVSVDRLREFARGKVNFVYWRREGRTFVLVGNRSIEELRRLATPVAGGTAIEGG